MLYQKIQRKVDLQSGQKEKMSVQNIKLTLLNLSYFNNSCIFGVQIDRVEGGTHYSWMNAELQKKVSDLPCWLKTFIEAIVR